MSVCLKRGVRPRLLQLPLVPKFLCMWLGWLVERLCAVVMLVAFGRLHLDDSAIDGVGSRLDSVMVVLRGTLNGLTVGIMVGTLGIGVYGCMDCVICLLSLVGGMGMLAGAFTLGTCCVLQKWLGLMVSSNWWGFVCMQACVASMIHCKSCAA
jgi:hypothetical protein